MLILMAIDISDARTMPVVGATRTRKQIVFGDVISHFSKRYISAVTAQQRCHSLARDDLIRFFLRTGLFKFSSSISLSFQSYHRHTEEKHMKALIIKPMRPLCTKKV